MDESHVVIHVNCYPLALQARYGDTEPVRVQGSFLLSQSTTHAGRLSVSLTEIKNRLLKKSIHKGRLLGLKRTDAAPRAMALYELDNLPATSNLYEYDCVLARESDDTETFDLQLLADLGQLEPNQVRSADDKLIRDLAYASDQIEGSTVRWRDSRRFDIDRPPRAGMGQDESDFIYHCQTIRDMVIPFASRDKTVRDIDEPFMRGLHLSLRLAELPVEQHGRYKQEQNWPGSRTLDELDDAEGYSYFTPPDLVEDHVQTMFAELYARDERVRESLHSRDASSAFQVLETASWFHWKFVQIHPFLDGNGRVARLLLNAYLVLRGFPLSSIQPEVRHVYFGVFALCMATISLTAR